MEGSLAITRGQLEEILENHIPESLLSKEVCIDGIINACEIKSEINASSWNGTPQ